VTPSSTVAGSGLPPPVHPIERVLGAACNPRLSEAQAQLLERCVAEVRDWSDLPAQLAAHRLGPLLHWQLREYGISPPAPVKRLLAGLYLRQRGIADTQADVLAELLTRLAAAGIEAVVLKGGALAHAHYPEPALRPMDDLDLLVAESMLARTREQLLDMGLQAAIPRNHYERRLHHWPVAFGVRNGMRIQIEVHRRVLNARLGSGLTHAALSRPLQAFTVRGQTAFALRHEQFLTTQLHRARHLSDPFRGIAFADLAGLAEAIASAADWPGPACLPAPARRALAVVQAMTPLSAVACARLGLDATKPTGQIAPTQAMFHGWPMPREALPACFKPPARLRATLVPSPQWIQLAYGYPAGVPTLLGWLFHHPLNALGQSLRRLGMGRADAQR
jgi:hypothetical protein